MIVFLAVFVTYACTGICLFGRKVEDFASFPHALHACFLMLLGEFDWHEMKSVGKAEAYLWFWTFNVVVLWVMFNMVLAIIMDSYMQIKSQLGEHSETLGDEAMEMATRWRQSRQG